MWVVELQFDGGARTEKIWLKAGEHYMGRRPCSYVFSDNFSQQISRKQAVFTVKCGLPDEPPTLEMKNISASCPMRKNANDYIPSGDTVSLVEGDTVEFGRKESSLDIKLLFHYEAMVWCTTGLSTKERSQTKAVGQSLGIPIVADFKDQVTHMIARQTPAPSAKLFFALLNGSLVVDFAWIARLAGLLNLQRVGQDSAAIIVDAKSYQPSLKRLENTILRAASASQAQVQDISASQAVVPAVDQVELDFNPQKSRSELFKNATIIFVEPDKVHEQFIRMGGGTVLHISPKLSLSQAIAFNSKKATNSLAIFQNTSSKKMGAKFEIDPAYVFITDVDIVNAILTNVKPEIQWVAKPKPAIMSPPPVVSNRKRKRSKATKECESEKEAITVIADTPEKVDLTGIDTTVKFSSSPSKGADKSSDAGGAHTGSSENAKHATTSMKQESQPKREWLPSKAAAQEGDEERSSSKAKQDTRSTPKQDATTEIQDNCSELPKAEPSSGASADTTLEQKSKEEPNTKRNKAVNVWKVADSKKLVPSELVVVRNLLCTRTKPVEPTTDEAEANTKASNVEKDFKRFRKNTVIVRSHQQPAYKFQTVKVRETERLRYLREMEEKKEQEYQRMQAFFRKSANESRPKAKRAKRGRRRR